MTITILYVYTYGCLITKLFKGNFWAIFYRQAPDAEAGRESTTATDDDEDAQKCDTISNKVDECRRHKLLQMSLPKLLGWVSFCVD